MNIWLHNQINQLKSANKGFFCETFPVSVKKKIGIEQITRKDIKTFTHISKLGI